MLRILTENKNFPRILDLLKPLPGATIYSAIGLWHGVRERSLIIELSGISFPTVTDLAKRIGEMNGQESVLIQDIPSLDSLLNTSNHSPQPTSQG